MSLGGSGDAFLVLGLLRAFCAFHGRSDVRVVLKPRLAAVGRLYGLPFEVDGDLIARAEADHEDFWTYPNDFLVETPYFVHPCFLRSPTSIDKLTTRWEASQLDMYKMLLHLPFEAKFELPPIENRIAGRFPVNPRSVVMLTDSTSWPNTQPGFWPRLADRLGADGWQVHVNNKSEDLDTLLDRCRRAAWAIGPQCGVMSILVSGEFSCRKTLATPNIDGNLRPEYLARETFPYGYVTKFANHDYDVEEFKISDGNHDELIEQIVGGVNARALWPHDPAPVTTIQAPLAPGDFVDRLAVLAVKLERFDKTRAAAIRREYDRYSEIARQMPNFPTDYFGRLVELHRTCYELLARIVPGAVYDGALSTVDHVTAIRLNKQRVELKKSIDVLLHAPYGEVKDYYRNPEKPDGL